MWLGDNGNEITDGTIDIIGHVKEIADGDEIYGNARMMNGKVRQSAVTWLLVSIARLVRPVETVRRRLSS